MSEVIKVQRKPIIEHARLIAEGDIIEIIKDGVVIKGTPGNYVIIDEHDNKTIISKEEFDENYTIIGLTKPVEVQREKTPAPIGNKPTSGLGGLFNGTTWG